MKFIVLMQNEEKSSEVAYPGYSMFSEVNTNGDLTLYKNHYNMSMPMAVANYAAGTWIQALAEFDKQVE